MADPSRYDKDPGALAWARGKIEATAKRYEAFAEREAALGHHKAAAIWQRIADTVRQDLIGIPGGVIGSFDERLPAMETTPASPRPVIPWQRDPATEQGIPGQVAYRADLGDHSFLLLGRTSAFPERWVAQVDGRMLSDGATDRESATLAAEEKWAEIAARTEKR